MNEGLPLPEPVQADNMPEDPPQDPKDGELCLGRAKPEETLVEARSGPDVQTVVRPGYRGERLIEPSKCYHDEATTDCTALVAVIELLAMEGSFLKPFSYQTITSLFR